MLKRILENASMHSIVCNGVHFQRITSLQLAHLVKPKPRIEEDNSTIPWDRILYFPSNAYLLHKKYFLSIERNRFYSDNTVI